MSHMAKVRSGIEFATTCAALVMALLVIARLVINSYAPQPQPGQQPVANNRPELPAKGMLLPSAKPFIAGDRTLIVALSSKCRFCVSSLPALKSLAEVADQSQGYSRVVAVFPKGDAQATAFLADAGVQIPATSDIAFPDLRVRGTPTFLLLDRQARVVDAWTGAPSEAAAERLKAGLRRL
jgi:hypothetical protein